MRARLPGCLNLSKIKEKIFRRCLRRDSQCLLWGAALERGPQRLTKHQTASRNLAKTCVGGFCKQEWPEGTGDWASWVKIIKCWLNQGWAGKAFWLPGTGNWKVFNENTFPFYGKGTRIRKCDGKGREIWGLYSRESRETGIPAHPWAKQTELQGALVKYDQHLHVVTESKMDSEPKNKRGSKQESESPFSFKRIKQLL